MTGAALASAKAHAPPHPNFCPRRDGNRPGAAKGPNPSSPEETFHVQHRTTPGLVRP